MATIGSFTASGNGFSGTIKTLNLNVKATIRTVERTSEKGPDYRILAGATEFLERRHRSRRRHVLCANWSHRSGLRSTTSSE
jgi:uncharacterized protein (DUF736 family)